MIGVETRKNVVPSPPGDKHERNLRLVAWNEREGEGGGRGGIHIFRLSIAYESNGDLEIREGISHWYYY